MAKEPTKEIEITKEISDAFSFLLELVESWPRLSKRLNFIITNGQEK